MLYLFCSIYLIEKWQICKWPICKQTVHPAAPLQSGSKCIAASWSGQLKRQRCSYLPMYQLTWHALTIDPKTFMQEANRTACTKYRGFHEISQPFLLLQPHVKKQISDHIITTEGLWDWSDWSKSCERIITVDIYIVYHRDVAAACANRYCRRYDCADWIYYWAALILCVSCRHQATNWWYDSWYHMGLYLCFLVDWKLGVLGRQRGAVLGWDIQLVESIVFPAFSACKRIFALPFWRNWTWECQEYKLCAWDLATSTKGISFFYHRMCSFCGATR